MTSTRERHAQAIAKPAADPTIATPYLLLDLEAAVQRYRQIAATFGPRSVHYAVKANPHPALVEALVQAGSRFDVSSAGEVDLCLTAGADPSHLIYSNPMKRRTDIEHAHGLGVRLFVADSIDEVRKLAASASGCGVLVRLATTGAGSDWPLSSKFGCPPNEAVHLLTTAASLGLGPAGLSFHVGSQQRDPERWDPPIAKAAELFGAELAPAVLAGPTCDSVDVLYEKTPVWLPVALAEGDQVRFRSAGAYTASYSTVGFNGFAPLPTVLV